MIEFLYQVGELEGKTADIISSLQNILEKKMAQCSEDEINHGDRIIISLGKHEDCVSDVNEYLFSRRTILSMIADPVLYCAFMPSCFPNSIFADDIVEPMREIKSFGEHAKEITENLIVLDEQAVKLYQQYKPNLDEALKHLSSLLRKCSLESRKHKDIIRFRFSYEETINGKNVPRDKEIVCSPHLKLIRPNSDLRIYFYWCDDDI